eukprot:jgi/Galph1/4931/GphlegSOOS_G3538.1
MSRNILKRYGSLLSDHQTGNSFTLRQQTRTNRANNQVRSPFLATGLVADATGSGYVEIGHTKVFASVQGPRPPIRSKSLDLNLKGNINCEVLHSVFCKPLGKSQTNSVVDEERLLSLRIVRIFDPIVRLEKYPKCSLYIFILIVEDDGSLFSAMTLATSLALADASIEMSSIVSSATVAVNKGKEWLVDPDDRETEAATGLVTVSLPLNTPRLCETYYTGRLSSEELLSATQLAIQVAQSVGDSVCNYLLQKMEQKSPLAK